MTHPTGAQIETKKSTFWQAHWPVIVTLLLAYLGWLLFLQERTSAIVMAVGTVGMIVFLALFKMEKNLWLYIATLLLCCADTIIDDQYVISLMWLGWLPKWTAGIILISVQGAVFSFICILLLQLFVFRQQGSAVLLVKVPLCLMFMIAALYHTFILCWLILAVFGFAPFD